MIPPTPNSDPVAPKASVGRRAAHFLIASLVWAGSLAALYIMVRERWETPWTTMPPWRPVLALGVVALLPVVVRVAKLSASTLGWLSAAVLVAAILTLGPSPLTTAWNAAFPELGLIAAVGLGLGFIVPAWPWPALGAIAVVVLWSVAPLGMVLMSGAIAGGDTPMPPPLIGPWTILPDWLHPLNIFTLVLAPALALGALFRGLHLRNVAGAATPSRGSLMVSALAVMGALGVAALAAIPLAPQAPPAPDGLAQPLGDTDSGVTHGSPAGAKVPLDRVRSGPGQGATTITAADGSTLIIATRGYHAMTPAARERAPQWSLRARVVRGAHATLPSVGWIDVRDEAGMKVRGLKAKDFEIQDADREIHTFQFASDPMDAPPAFAPPYIWIANSSEGTVSKLDTRTGEELGRYPVGASPSRTAVDLDGNVYIASRGHHLLTKIRSGGCEGDACIVWQVPTCRGARGVAVDRDNGVWVGGGSLKPGRAQIDGCLRRVDGEDGATLFERNDLPAPVYGLALDQKGTLWGVLRIGHQLMELRPSATGVPKVAFHPAPAPHDLYGMAVDGNGRVWVANNKEGDILRFSPTTGGWDRFASPVRPQTRGVAADASGQIWVANSDPSSVSRFDADSGDWTGDFKVEGNWPVGVAIDSDQQVWVVNQLSNNANRLDPDTGEVTGVYPVGSGPYTYSDMTGYALNTFVGGEGLYRLAWIPSPLIVAVQTPGDGTVVPTDPAGPIPLEARFELLDPEDPPVAFWWTVDGAEVARNTQAPFALGAALEAAWTAKAIAEGPHTVAVSVQTQSGFIATDSSSIRAVQQAGRLSVSLVADGAPASAPPMTVLFVLDVSGSMLRRVGNERRIDAAKRALLAQVERLPDATQVGLRVYGHRTKRCTDTELVQAVGPLIRSEFRAVVQGLKPRGSTPIARSLDAAAGDLDAQMEPGGLGLKRVVLITDGLETCGGDPCAAAEGLSKATGARAYIIGFGLGRKKSRRTLSCIADATGGIYTDADDAAALGDRLADALRFYWTVFNAEGQVVHQASFDAPSVQLPSGAYRVGFGASAPDAAPGAEAGAETGGEEAPKDGAGITALGVALTPVTVSSARDSNVALDISDLARPKGVLTSSPDPTTTTP